jgi:thiosulfate/3-mercaptopyruvate sulfurtransferase
MGIWAYIPFLISRTEKTTMEESLTTLIDAEELNTILGQSNLKIFDVRGIWGADPSPLPDDYKAAHIPGAVFLNWRKEFIEQDVAPNLAQVSSYTDAKVSFERLGINAGDRVVLYDNYHHMFAGRLWWSMRYWGFENVQVLNGGIKYWESQNLPLSAEIPDASPGSFEPMCQDHLRIPMNDFLIEKQNTCLLDGRGRAGYEGKPEDPRTGHIPGAISVAYNTLQDKETGLFLKRDEIVALFNKVIPDWRTERIISSCGAGYSGTVPMLALAQLGIETSLFDESFSVWKLDPDRPVEQSH